MHELRRYGIIGLWSVAPFLILNTIVSLPIQPLLNMIRPTGHTSLREIILLGMSMLWAGYGATTLLWPIRRTTPWAVVRIMGGFGLFALILLLTYAIGEEIYRCDIIGQLPCD